jgi:hypothetical protein
MEALGKVYVGQGLKRGKAGKFTVCIIVRERPIFT